MYHIMDSKFTFSRQHRSLRDVLKRSRKCPYFIKTFPGYLKGISWKCVILINCALKIREKERMSILQEIL